MSHVRVTLATAAMEGNEESLSAHLTAFYAILVVFLVLGAGLMSGLTLGLLSLDVLDLEVSLLAWPAPLAHVVSCNRATSGLGTITRTPESSQNAVAVIHAACT